MEIVIILILPIFLYFAVVNGMKDGYKKIQEADTDKFQYSEKIAMILISNKIISRKELENYREIERISKVKDNNDLEYSSGKKLLNDLRNRKVISEKDYQEKNDKLNKLYGYEE